MNASGMFLDLHKPVDGPEKGDVLVGGVDGGQADEHEDEGGAGHAGGGDRGGGGRQDDGDVVARVELDVVHLGDEDGGDGDEDGGAVHVDGGADRQHELGDPLVHLVVDPHAAEGDGQSSGSVTAHFEFPAISSRARRNHEMRLLEGQ